MTGDSPEQTTSEETETSEEKSEEITETAKRITSWTWNDEEEMLDLEENVLALPGASKDHIVSLMTSYHSSYLYHSHDYNICVCYRNRGYRSNR